MAAICTLVCKFVSEAVTTQFYPGVDLDKGGLGGNKEILGMYSAATIPLKARSELNSVAPLNASREVCQLTVVLLSCDPDDAGQGIAPV